jgi:hypothetical protein
MLLPPRPSTVFAPRIAVPEETKEPEGIDAYDWLSIFRTLEQAGSYASPYAEGGRVVDTILDILGQGSYKQDNK